MAGQLQHDAFHQISDLLAEKLRVRHGSFAQRVRKAGPKLPKKVRRAAEQLVEMQALAQHPKIARQIDEASVRTSSIVVIDYLETIDPWDIFKGRILRILGWISALLIIGFIAAVWLARSRGMI